MEMILNSEHPLRRRICAAATAFGMILAFGCHIPFGQKAAAATYEIPVSDESNLRVEDDTSTVQSVNPQEYSDDDETAIYDSKGYLKTEYRKYESTPIMYFRVTNLSPQADTTMDYVNIWYSPYNDDRYIFLPATANRSDLVIQFALQNASHLTLNDQAVISGAHTSILATADDFTIKADSTLCGTVHVLQSDLNVMYLSTPTGGTAWIDKYGANREKSQECQTLMLTNTGAVSYDGTIASLKRHGNSSWDYSTKKPYNMKLPAKANLYGLGKAKKWVLLSNNIDQSMLRNAVTSEMSRQSGIEYTMDYTFVDLFCDGDYRGTYQLYEKVQIQKQRVNITDLEEATEALNTYDLETYGTSGTQDYAIGTYRYWNIPNNPTDITGGYLIQFQLSNRYKSKAESGFVTSRGQAIDIVSPEYASKAQVEYIRKFVQELEDAIYSPTGINSKGKHYSDYIDVDSLLLGYLIQEITQNADGTFTSFYFYKDSDSKGDGKLHYGPVWDFDLAYYNFSRGVACAIETGDAKTPWLTHYSGAVNSLFIAYFPIHGWAKEEGFDCATLGIGWIMQLYQNDESFRKRAAELYYERFDDYITQLVDQTQPGGCGIDQMRDALSASAAMNNARWHMYGPRPYKIMGPYNGETYEDIVEFMRSWLVKRQSFLQKEWVSAVTEPLAEQLEDDLANLDDTRYDEEGLAQLKELVAAGQEAVLACQTPEEAQTAYQNAVASLNTVPKTVIYGDFDDNMIVDARDAQLVLDFYAQLIANLNPQATATQLRNGDVDGNGTLDSIDAMHILRYYTLMQIGIDYALPVHTQRDGEET